MGIGPPHAFKRAQMNMWIKPVDKIKLMKHFPEALLPLLWFEEEIKMPKFLVDQIMLGVYAMAVIK